MERLAGGRDDVGFLHAKEIAAHEVQVGDAAAVQLGGDIRGEGDGIFVLHEIVAVQRRDAHADVVGSPNADDGIRDLEEQPGAVGQRAAVGTRAAVAAAAQEFIEKITVGAVDFDAVKAGGLGVHRGVAEARNDAGQLVVAQLARDLVGFLTLRGVRLVVLDPQRARCHGLGAVVEERVAGAAAMPELQEDPAALGVDGIGDFFPTRHLGRGVDAGFPSAEGRIALNHHGGLGDKQSGAGALGIILRHDLGRHVLGIRPAARERRHQDAVGERQGAEFDRSEERIVGHEETGDGWGGSAPHSDSANSQPRIGFKGRIGRSVGRRG